MKISQKKLMKKLKMPAQTNNEKFVNAFQE